MEEMNIARCKIYKQDNFRLQQHCSIISGINEAKFHGLGFCTLSPSHHGVPASPLHTASPPFPAVITVRLLLSTPCAAPARRTVLAACPAFLRRQGTDIQLPMFSSSLLSSLINVHKTRRYLIPWRALSGTASEFNQ